MVNLITTSEELTEVADKIRSKTGGSDTLEYPDGFKGAIEGIVTLDAGTADADAAAGDIRNGKTAYVMGEKITGEFNGVDTSDATATSEDIRSGKTAYAQGVKCTGSAIVTSKTELDELKYAIREKMNLVNILEPDLKATLKAGKEYVISAERKQMTSKVTITYQRNGESATFQFVAGMQGQRASTSLGEASISDVAVVLSEDARFTKWQINERPASWAAAYEEPPVFANFPDDYVENIGEIIKGSPSGEVEERQLIQVTPSESITVPADSYAELATVEVTADDPWIPIKYTSVHINSSATERLSSFHILTEVQQLYGQANKFVITYKLKSATGSAITVGTGTTTIRAICARIRTSA